VLEGEWRPQRLTIVEFDSMEKAKAFYTSPEYGAAIKARAGAAKFKARVVQGIWKAGRSSWKRLRAGRTRQEGRRGALSLGPGNQLNLLDHRASHACPILSLDRLSFSDKEGQVTVRYYDLYANASRGKIRKASLAAFPFRIVEDELRRLPSKGWAEMIRKVYEVDTLVCPQCGGTMKVIVFLSDCAVLDGIIGHLKLPFVAGRPPPTHLPYQEVLMAAETGAEYFS
jgi:hypothetical protein